MIQRILRLLLRLINSFQFIFNRLPDDGKDLRTIYIMGNGPSLTDSLDIIIRRDHSIPIVGVNDFILSPLSQELKPDYFVLLDPGYFTLNTKYVPKEQIEINQQIIRSLNNVGWQMILLLPYHLKKEINDSFRITNPNISIRFFNTNNFNLVFNSNFFYKINFAAPQMQNVLTAAIFLCTQMRFKNIYFS